LIDLEIYLFVLDLTHFSSGLEHSIAADVLSSQGIHASYGLLTGKRFAYRDCPVYLDRFATGKTKIFI
jgi:hypothetical protein